MDQRPIENLNFCIKIDLIGFTLKMKKKPGTHQIIYMLPNILVSLLGCRHHETYCSQYQERVEKFANYPSQPPPNYFPVVRKSGLESNVQFQSTDVVFAQPKTS